MRKSSWACALIGLAISQPALARSVTVTGVGQILCQDGDGTLVPLPGATVELMDSDCDGSSICDDLMGTGVTDSSGNFSVTGTGGDPGDYHWSNPDPYVRVMYDDGAGVRVTDELDDTQWNSSPQHSHDNFGGGTIDFGAYVAGSGSSGGYGTMCSVWQKSRQAFADYKTIMAGKEPPAGHFDILYWAAIVSGTPWTNTDTVHWPRGFPSFAARHEFWHSVRHAADGDGSHFSWDVTRFRYARNHNICDSRANRIPSDTEAMDRAFAFNEGWAEFWNGELMDCGQPSWGDRLEGNVAPALRDLAVAHGQRALIQTLLSNPGKIHSLDEFRSALDQLGQALTVFSIPSPPISAATEIARSNADQLLAIRQVVNSLSRQRETRVADYARARAKAAQTTLCTPEDCEAAVRAKVAPALMQAELAVLDLRLARLRRALDPAYRRQQEMLRGRGQIDAWMHAQAKQWRAQEQGRLLQGTAAALESASSLGAKSAAARQLLASLKQRFSRLPSEWRKDNVAPVASELAPDDLEARRR